MNFVLRMALREIRSSWQRLLFFFVCIAIGVASIVAIRSVIQSVRITLAGEARALLASDAIVTSNRAWTEPVLKVLEAEQQAGRILARSEAVEVPTMVRPSDPLKPFSRMVELRAVQSQFPFYGTLGVEGRPYSHALLQGHGVIVRPELLPQLGLAVGDRLQIGTQSFEIRGVLTAEPGRRLGAFTLGPRIFIDHADLESTGLLAFGSRASFQTLLRVPDTMLEPLTRSLRQAFVNEFVGIRHYRRSEDQIGENLTRAENYLSLVGLVVLILGGIGVSSVTRVFVQQKVRSIAILKCVGGTTPKVLGVYMTQVLLLGLAGSSLGVALAAAVVAAVPVFAGDLAALLPIEYGLTAGAVWQGLAVGLLVSILFSVVPLLEVRHVKPSLLLRQDTPPPAGFDWLKWGVTAAVAITLVGVASWQAGSVPVGLLLSGGFVATAFVLHLAGLALVRAVQPLRYARSFALRQAVLHIARPGNQTRVILLAVGLGAFFILGVRGLQANLLRDFSVQVGPDAPDMFLIDIQSDQRDRIAAFLDRGQRCGAAAQGDADPAGARRRRAGARRRAGELPAGARTRPRPRIHRHLPRATSKPTRKSWRGSGGTTPRRPANRKSRSRRASAARSVARSTIGRGRDDRRAQRRPTCPMPARNRIRIGDRMRFDVLGRIVTARVASVRRVDWQDFRAGGFMFVFRPGAFDDAPHTFISALQGPQDAGARARMQADLAAQFPNVSVIDLREILHTIQGIVSNVTLAVTVVGGLVLFSGALILIGAVSMTKFQRVYEAAILKTLGASSRLIATMLVLEYGVLGAIAGTVGALGAIALSWAVARYALDLPWEATPGLTLIGIAATVDFVAVVGVLASADVLRHKPLATLRAE